METATKQIDVRTKSVKPTEADWDKIRGFMVAPDEFKEEDIRVYEARLANNFPDRDGERFNKAVLNSLNRTIVGKSVLMGHQWGPPGIGRFIEAHLEKMGMEDTMQLIGHTSEKRMQKMLARINDADGGIFFMNVKFYMLADSPEVRKIDAGIYSFMSIGFRAPQKAEVKTDSGEVMWKEYQNTKDLDSEALEGSFVFLGAQHGAATKDIEKSGGYKMTFELKALNLSLDVDSEQEDSVKAAVAAIEAKFAEADALRKQAVDELAAFKSALGEGVTPEKAKDIVAQANAHKDALIAEAVKYGALVGLIPAEKVDSRKAMLAKLTVEEITVTAEEYKKLFNERNPQVGAIKEPAPAKEHAVSNHRYAETF